MTSEIKSLVEIWNKGPLHVSAEEHSHLVYVFGELLPALNRAIPEIVQMSTMLVDIGAATAARSEPTSPGLLLPAGFQKPSSVGEEGPGLDSSSHNREANLSRGDSGVIQDRTAGISDTPASSAATPGEPPAVPASSAVAKPKLTKAQSLANARAAKAKKSTVVPPEPPQGTGDTATT